MNRVFFVVLAKLKLKFAKHLKKRQKNRIIRDNHKNKEITMPKFFVTSEDIHQEEIKITGKDVNHIKNVLRKKIGEELTICNQDLSTDYLCKIIGMQEDSIQCHIIKQLETNSEANIKVSIFQGLPKADKMEWVIQKAVELGVYDITPIEMKRCVVKLTDKDKIKKLQRWQKIAEVAAKQSGRNRIPSINKIESIKNICNLCSDYDIVIVAYENEKENKLKYELQKLKHLPTEDFKIAVLIGPEGGIDASEIQCLKEKGAKIVTLGNRILRTETVALNVLSIIMYELEI